MTESSADSPTDDDPLPFQQMRLEGRARYLDAQPSPDVFFPEHNNVHVAAAAFVSDCLCPLRRQVRLGIRLSEDLPLFLQHNQMQQCDPRFSAGDGPQR